jgi:hypothetical protein
MLTFIGIRVYRFVLKIIGVFHRLRLCGKQGADKQEENKQEDDS